MGKLLLVLKNVVNYFNIAPIYVKFDYGNHDGALYNININIVINLIAFVEMHE